MADVTIAAPGGEEVRLNPGTLAEVVIWLLAQSLPDAGVECVACGHGADHHDLNSYTHCRWPQPSGPQVSLCTCPEYRPAT